MLHQGRVDVLCFLRKSQHVKSHEPSAVQVATVRHPAYFGHQDCLVSLPTRLTSSISKKAARRLPPYAAVRPARQPAVLNRKGLPVLQAHARHRRHTAAALALAALATAVVTGTAAAAPSSDGASPAPAASAAPSGADQL